MRVDGSGSIDPKHVELVKHVSERFKLNGVEKSDKTGERESDLVLAKLLQSFKSNRLNYVAKVRESLQSSDIDVKAIGQALLEKTKEDAGI
jgi:hypothetical protein